jgi:hypothetical protein
MAHKTVKLVGAAVHEAKLGRDQVQMSFSCELCGKTETRIVPKHMANGLRKTWARDHGEGGACSR